MGYFDTSKGPFSSEKALAKLSQAGGPGHRDPKASRDQGGKMTAKLEGAESLASRGVVENAAIAHKLPRRRSGSKRSQASGRRRGARQASRDPSRSPNMQRSMPRNAPVVGDSFDEITLELDSNSSHRSARGSGLPPWLQQGSDAARPGPLLEPALPRSFPWAQVLGLTCLGLVAVGSLLYAAEGISHRQQQAKSMLAQSPAVVAPSVPGLPGSSGAHPLAGASPAPSVAASPTPSVAAAGLVQPAASPAQPGDAAAQAPAAPTGQQVFPAAYPAKRSAASMAPAPAPKKPKIRRSRRARAPKQGAAALPDRSVVGSLVVGEAKASRGCKAISGEIAASLHERVNVCFELLAGKGAREVTVQWLHEGKVVRQSQVQLPAGKREHSLRAFAPIRSGQSGAWQVQIKSTQGRVLARKGFRVGM